MVWFSFTNNAQADLAFKFPDNKPLLAASVGFYTAACLVLQWMAHFVEKSYVVWTYDKDDKPGSALKIATTLERGDHMLGVDIEFRNPPEGCKTSKESFTKSVGNYFSEKGEIDEICLQRDLQVAIHKLEEIYDSHASKKSN